MSTVKTHNRTGAVAAKEDLRSRVLSNIKKAHVLDVFCGPEGEMYNRVWHRATSYVGIDTEWSPKDARRRFVGDNQRILRAIDLSPYNVFDLDAFGSPWEQAIVVADRRAWSTGERGAIVITDGAGMNLRMGRMHGAMGELLGVGARSGLAPAGDKEGLTRMALHAWAKRARVKIVQEWRAFSARGSKGNMPMTYMAAIFEGTGAPARNA